MRPQSKNLRCKSDLSDLALSICRAVILEILKSLDTMPPDNYCLRSLTKLPLNKDLRIAANRAGHCDRDSLPFMAVDHPRM
jgi:hypothetical protein